MLAKLMKASSLRASLGYGVSGAAFALGNLLLARAMPVEEYGSYALFVAISNIFALMAPLGFDQASLRYNAHLTGAAFMRVAISGLLAGLVAAAISSALYGTDLSVAGLMLVAVVAGGIGNVASAGLRRDGHIVAALLVSNSANWSILISGCLALLWHIQLASVATVLLVIGVLIAAGWGWLLARRSQRQFQGSAQHVPLVEVAAFVAIIGATGIVVQIERLVAPGLLGVEAVAIFGVLASVALFPYRMLQSGVAFSLAPKLRAAKSAGKRNQIIRHELISVAGVTIAASLGVLLMAGPLAELLTGGRYQLGIWLVAAACFNGMAKVVSALPRALITACGTQGELAALGLQAWLLVACGVLGAWAGSSDGLTGLVCGAGVGTLIGSLPAIRLAQKALSNAAKREAQESAPGSPL
jgi:O-antigen/teichoic acid export membrane protein